MSCKPTTNDTIVTRLKLAQQRLRPIDRSMTTLTKLLKKPQKKLKSATVAKRSPKSSPSKIQRQSPKKSSIKSGPSNPKSDVKGISIEEYYPNKLKRHVFAKKIVLKPNNNLKIVARTSKRKFAIPQRGIGSPEASPIHISDASSPEMSMNDAIKIFDETQELDDEDLMEILTCPSPVWWEDPPDATYIEDPICRRTPPDIDAEQKENHVTVGDSKSNLDINLQDKDINFKSKRSKLECLLNNLKDKVSIEKINENNNEFDKSSHNDPVVSSKEINQVNESNKRKSRYKSKLRTKGASSIVNKVVKRRRKPSILAKNQKSKRKCKKVLKNVFSSIGSIKIKNPDEINKGVEDDLNLKKNHPKDSEKDGEENNSEAKEILDNSNKGLIVHHVADFQVNKDKTQEDKIKNESDMKDRDSILSDNTDLSEISINDDLLRDLENINIPIGESSILEEKDIKTTITNEDNINTVKPEVCENIIEEGTNNEISEEFIEPVIKTQSNENEDNNIDSKISIDDNNTVATSSTVDNTENIDRNSTPINFYDEEQSYDPHEFDLQFENAILGLENTVLRPAKTKKRKAILNTKLHTKLVSNKDTKVQKDKKTDINDKISPACPIIEPGTSTEVIDVKRNKIIATKEETEFAIKPETLNSGDSTITKMEDVSSRGRIRRKKAHFDDDYNKTKSKKDIKRKSDGPKCSPQLLKNRISNKPPQTKNTNAVFRSLGHSIVEYTRMKRAVEKSLLNKINNTRMEDANDISKRGRLRRKNNRYDIEFNSKVKYETIKALNNRSQPTVVPQKKYYNKKKSKTSIQLIDFDGTKKFKARQSNAVVDSVLNDLKTKFTIKTETLTKSYLNKPVSDSSENLANIVKNEKISVDIKSESKQSNTEIDDASNMAISDSEKNTWDSLSNSPKNNSMYDETETCVSIYKQYRGKKPINYNDSISDIGVTFIDEAGTGADGKSKNNKIKTYNAEIPEDADGTGNTDSNDSDSNTFHNLGPNFKELAIKPDTGESPDKQNKHLVLNTTSKKLVTVQSDKELFDTNTSDDIETITVFKITPKEI